MVREQYDVRWKDYYEILQVHPRAEAEVILAAYRKLAQIYHPDKVGSTPFASTRMADINEAKEVLTDQHRRGRYDEVYWSINQTTDPTHERAWGEAASDWSDGGQQWPRAESEPSSSESPSWEPEAGGTSYEEDQSLRSRIFSFSSFMTVLSNLVARLSPNPDESQRITPWPSWSWQRLYLMGSVPLGLFVFLVSASQGAWAPLVIGLAMVGAAVYAGVATRWMRTTREAPVKARLAGGACITIGGASFVIAIAYLVAIVIFLVLAVMFLGVFLRAMLEEALKKTK